MGGVFLPVLGKGQRPAYNCSPKGATGGDQLLLFTCPVSVIPTEIWDLLQLWWACRLSGLPPVPGGFMDQPRIVQMAFPIFEAQMRIVEANQRQSDQQNAAGMAAAATAKLLMGGR